MQRQLLGFDFRRLYGVRRQPHGAVDVVQVRRQYALRNYGLVVGYKAARLNRRVPALGGQVIPKKF